LRSTLFGSALLALVEATSGHTNAPQHRPPGQESSLIRAVFADGRLWLLSDAGELSSIAEGSTTRMPESLSEPSLDLCLSDGNPLVITCKESGCSNWMLRRRVAGKWAVEGTVPTEGDGLVALSCAAKEPTLLTTRRLIDAGRDKQTTVTLSEKMPSGMVALVHVARGQVFVGINAGEWGGGLRRIDPRSGKVTRIERNITGELCGGPLNTECDPVTGIAVEPWNHDCLLVSVGLVHFEPHGRIVEVCGDRVRQLYDRPYEQSTSHRKEKGHDAFGTVAFFGLALAGDALWATAIDGVYRIEASGVAPTTRLPHFRTIGGIGVSFDLPHLVLVLTTVNQRRSVSGSVPMLVPR
jgi:hypothetical protein